MISAKIKSIGADAISDQDALAILFDSSATPDLKKIAVVQEIENLKESEFKLKKNSILVINGIEYKAEFVGSLVNTNLQTIGHTTLAFKQMPEQPLESAIYLSPYQFPKFKVGDKIQYM